ncbi:EAL domain-containing protein [Paraconexibacter antarcticus]|uniref:EAL domain-containing protein n=1 Tax=Paraconexibacter antarcticus TaxID=2949664 RepID=A0ABY5DWY8_9ACTN|nr:GGDEF domain-containing phosphodiesterase [Paraconexibacter antarcticus]UTI65160.1 EAL domain-containing protein [Paraconexibacter antarcticus]
MPEVVWPGASEPAAGRARFWQATLDGLIESAAVLDGDGVIVAVNRAWTNFAEENGGSGVGLGADYLAVCDRAGEEEPVALEVASALRGIAAGASEHYARRYPCHAPGRERWFTMRAASVTDGRSGRTGRHTLVRHVDCTAQHLAERRGEEQAELLRAAGAAIIVVDADAVITNWSAGAEELFGWDADEVMGRDILSVVGDPADGDAARGVLAALMSGERTRLEVAMRRRDGTRVYVRLRTQVLRNSDRTPRGLIGASIDLTGRREAERSLRSARDFLATVTAAMPDGLLVLDGAGRVTLMNAAAEQLLGWSAAELAGQSMHARIHALHRDGSPRPQRASIAHACGHPGPAVRVDDDVFLRRDGTFLPVRYSATPLETEEPADGVVIVFTDITESKARELQVRRELEALSCVGRIRDALGEDGFAFYAQPIVRISDGEVVAHELLVRMLSTDGEVIAPDDFLPTAEQHGLIQAIDRRVFELALAHAALGHPVHVNLSADSISDPSTFCFVEHHLQLLGVDPALVTFEITETALIHNETVAQAFIENVRRLMCAVALDDFGTGYGSFRYLKHLPVTMLKIDQEFIRDLDTSNSDINRQVIEAIVALARGMGQTTVAEGVETATALEQLKELGVDCAQGYHFARPQPSYLLLKGA